MRVFGLIAFTVLAFASQADPQTLAPEPPSGLYPAALHTFSLLRSGVAIYDAATGVHHTASHTQDAFLAGTGEHRDLSGGWYNAADYGKWTMMTAITVSYMLDLYQLQQRASLHNGDKPDPQLLDEAQWGLAWMLKMQDADGGVRHKIDGATQASLSSSWGKPPELDPNVRIAAPAATGSTADFAAVMYQAGQFLKNTDPAQSRRFRAVADHAWDWLGKHPDVRAHDPFYADHDPDGELLWARSEHAIAYGLESSEIAREMDARVEPEVSANDPSLLGLYDLASARRSPLHLRKIAQMVILRQADTLARAASVRRFHIVLGDRDYSWGSAERVLHCAALFLMADSLQPTPLLHEVALDQLAWILGNNASNHSFITGFGENPVLHPWHWIYRDYGIVIPGWAVLGPNGYPDGVDPALKRLQERGTAPARCYVDLCTTEGSWASNEGEISEEAALVFVTGALRLSSPHQLRP